MTADSPNAAERASRTTAQTAQLALLLEVSSTPKPGNVDREREYPDLRFEQFLAGAIGAHGGFATVADGEPLGTGFERAVAGMSNQTGGNTQFGAVLVLTPLVAAAGRGALDPERATAVVDDTTVADAVSFYRAFEYVDVSVPEPPEGMTELDVRRGGDAAPALRERGLTLADVLERSAGRDGVAAELTGGFGWTFELADVIERGDGPVTESVVTTPGPNDLYNAAALGVHAPPDPEAGEPADNDSMPARARTWGRTRTRRNFEARGEGYVHFVRDPVLFVEAALGIHETEEPVLDSADAWVRVEVERTNTGREGGTEWVDWRLVPVESTTRRTVVPVSNRGYAAVIEATVAASRLDVDAYDTDTLRERIDYFQGVTERCGGPAERAAFERIYDLVDVDGTTG